MMGKTINANPVSRIEGQAKNQLEMMVRAYDPCLSCGTHTTQADSSLTYDTELVNSKGVVIKKW